MSENKKAYLIGIGGISMSAIAFILKENGYLVEGSDANRNEEVEKLEKNGIKVHIGHKKENITDDITVVIYSKAIHDDNEEMMEAKRKNLVIKSRSAVIGEIMGDYENRICIAGTHGKTTTTSIISKIMVEAGFDPTINVGGIVKDLGGNYVIGKNKNYFVLESCEYTNSFLDFKPTFEIITNIKEDHLDFFKDLADIRNSFRQFINLLPENGTLIINNSIENIDELTKDTKAKIYTYGKIKENGEKPDFYYEDVKQDGVYQEFSIYVKDDKVATIQTCLMGNHNVENIVAAVVCLMENGVALDDIKNIIRDFRGADRRLEVKGEYNGIKIIDDYAHHPDEIEASIKAIKSMNYNHLHLIFEPHTFSRTKALFDEFVNVLCTVENVGISKIYKAREVDDGTISSKDLVNKINESRISNANKAKYFDTYDEIVDYIKEVPKSGDLVVLMGAGTIYKVYDMLIASK